MRKGTTLEFAILGLLREAPLHGYELRKRLNAMLGTFRVISFGSLYPALKGLGADGAVEETVDQGDTRRQRITYRLTPVGQQRFDRLLAETGPETWDDEGFGVRFAFFGCTDSDVRTMILEGRRMRLAERRALMRETLARAAERVDDYTLELQRHGLDGVELELRWLDDLIANERHN